MKTVDDLSETILDTFFKIEQEMLSDISQGIFGDNWEFDQGERILSDPVKWKLQQLDNLGMLNKGTVKRLLPEMKIPLSTDKLRADINKMLIESGLSSVKLTDEEAREAIKNGAELITPKAFDVKDTQIKKILDAHQNKLESTLNLTNQTMLDQSKQMYIQGINEAAMQVTLGNKTPDQVFRGLVNRWAEMGIPAMIDSAGRKWGVEGYLNTVMRTHNAQIARQMQQDRMSKWGIGYTEVSKHPGDRPLCAPYAGRVFALTPEAATEEYPWIDDPAQGEKGHPASLFGINCGHTQYSFVPGVSIQRNFPSEDPEKDAQIYEESQRQRQLERSIRNAKTRKNLLHEAGDQPGVDRADKLIRVRQERMRGFINDTGRTRRYNREGLYTKPYEFGSGSDRSNRFFNVSDGHADLISHKNFMKQSVSYDENQAMKMYSGNSSQGVNMFLRNTSPKKYDTVKLMTKSTLRDMDAVFEKMKGSATTGLSQNTVMYRKVNPEDTAKIFKSQKVQDDIEAIIKASSDKDGANLVKDLEASLKKQLEGADFTDPAYFSTSRSSTAFKEGAPFQFDVKLPKGYNNGLFTEGLSFHSGEKEYLINSAQKWDIQKVVTKWDAKTAKYRIFVEITPMN